MYERKNVSPTLSISCSNLLILLFYMSIKLLISLVAKFETHFLFFRMSGFNYQYGQNGFDASGGYSEAAAGGKYF